MSGFRFFPRHGKSRTYRPATRSPHSDQPDLEDARRAEFIRAVDAQDFRLQMLDWDKDFALSMLERLRKDRPFTPKMRPILDKLIARYGHRIEWSGKPKQPGPVRSKTREASTKPII